MTTLTHPATSSPPRLGAFGGAAQARILAAALAHLLGRDDDRPARWVSAAFGAAVEARRADLAQLTTLADLLAFDPNARGEPSFVASVARLARNPDDVALAIRSLEISELRSLPGWAELIRRGLSSGSPEPDPALWFG